MKRSIRISSLAALLVLTGPAVAADTSGEPVTIHWRCWYDRETHIVCAIRKTPESVAQQTAAPNTPPIAKELWNNPAAFRNSIIRIPLYTRPYDLALTAVLARASVCGSRPDCFVDFTSRPPSVSELLVLIDPDEISSLDELAESSSDRPKP